MVRTINLRLNENLFNEFARKKQKIAEKMKRSVSWEEFFIIELKIK